MGKDNGATAVAFMRAVLRSLNWLHNPANRDEAVRIHARYIPFKAEWLEKIHDMLIREKMLSTDGRPKRRESRICCKYPSNTDRGCRSYQPWINGSI